MSPGDKVYLKLGGHWTEFIFQRLHSEFGDACTIWNGNGDQQCRTAELITEQAYKDMERERELPIAKARLADTVRLWNDGHKTGKAMAAIAGGAPIGWTSKIQSALRWGFIHKPPEYPQQPYATEPSPADKSDVQ